MRQLLLAVLLCSSAFAAPPFTIEQVLSAPFPDNLVASPKGDAMAWVQNASGVRNIWIARAPAYQARSITHFTKDDGQEIGELVFRPDSSAVLFTRGGGANGRGEFPNPLSAPESPAQEVWIVSLAGEAHKLGSGHRPAVAPDNSAVAWIAGDQVWWMKLGAKDPAAKPEPLFHERGKAREIAWSPDSTRLAFVSARSEHALAGVYDLRVKSVTWMDPSVDTDASLAWEPDGKQLAYIRLPAAPSEFEYGAHREGTPWAIRECDPATGVGRNVWRAEKGIGSVFRESGDGKQLIALEHRVIFPWEKDGWLHLYWVGTGGMTISFLGDPRDLDAHVKEAGVQAVKMMAGSFETEDFAASFDQKSVVFSSNQNDVDRRHLWRVSLGLPLSQGQPEQLTNGQGIEWSPTPLADGRIGFVHSDAHKPPRVALRETNGTVRDLAAQAIPPPFPEMSLVDPQPVTFPAADGLELHGQLFLPKDGVAKHPAVVFFHGGSRRQMLLGWHYMEYYFQTYGFNQYLASQGYVVLSVNYRSGVGYGMEFREALKYGATGASEDNDIVGAARYLDARTDVDRDRIGAWGGSYGGYLTALALARHSDLYKVGVDFHGIHDWNLEVDRYPGNAERKAEIAKIAFESSPLASIKTWKSPVLLVQGDDDRNVNFENSVEVAEALRKQGVIFRQIILPDEVHDFVVFGHWLEAFHASEQFLARYLK